LHYHFSTYSPLTAIHSCQPLTNFLIPSCCSHWLSRPCFLTQICFPNFFLKLPYPTSDCTDINIFIPHTACIRPWLSNGGIFSSHNNSITAHSLNRTSSQSSFSIGTEPVLRIAVGSRLCKVEDRYHVTVWNRFYLFFTIIKNMTKEAKFFSKSSYLGETSRSRIFC